MPRSKAVVLPMLAVILTSSALAGQTASAVGAASDTAVAPRVGTTGAWAIIGTLGSGGTDVYGIAVDIGDDSVYAALSAARIDVFKGGITVGTAADSVQLPFPAQFLAVDSDDDSLYATPNASFTSNGVLWSISGAALQLEDTIVTFAPRLNDLPNCPGTANDRFLTQPAVHQQDDTVYLAANCAGTGLLAVHGDDTIASRPLSAMGLAGTAPLGFWSVGVNQQDDTVYAAAWDGQPAQSNHNVFAFSDNFSADDSFSYRSSPGNPSRPGGVVVNSASGDVYTIDLLADPSVSSIFRLNADDLSVEDSASLDTMILGQLVAGPAADQLFTIAAGSRLLVIDPVTLTIDDSIGMPGNTAAYLYPPATSGNGLVYVALSDGVSVASEVTVTPTAWTGPSGTALSSTLTPAVASRLASTTILDDTTVSSVSFGDDTVPFTKSVNTLSFSAPAGTGSVTVRASLNGGNQITLGTFTYGSAPSPTPSPVLPPSAPRDVSAVAGTSSATVTWTAPASSGSFPITNYKVTSSPGGQTCLIAAPALTCTVDGLTNRTSYTFTVEALNGAGWSVKSAPSNPVTPQPDVTPTILITGYRGTGDATGRVYADGTTTHLAGTTVQARVRVAGQPEYADGSTRAVSADGTFTWQRRTNKKTYLYFTTEGISSNRIIIQAR